MPPGHFDISERSIVAMAPDALGCSIGGSGGGPSPFVAGRMADPERASRAGFLARVGFLKSRVYAKL
jgi:hypothetical protein